MYIGISNIRIGSQNATGNALSRLFSNRADGFWFAPRIGGSAFQDTSATVVADDYPDPVARLRDFSPNTNEPQQSTSTSRLTYGEHFVQGDMTADHLISTTGGGSSTAFYLCFGIMHRANAGGAQVMWSDRSGNTGILFQIASTGRLQCACGNGAALVTASPTTVLTPGTDYVVSAWYDGATLTVQIDGGTSNPSTIITASVTLVAGSSSFSLGGNLSSASLFGGRLYEGVYLKNSLPTEAQRNEARAYIRARMDELNLANETPRFYISNAGSDTNDGLWSGSAKATWADTDADYTLIEGDSVGLETDDTFSETITAPVDGLKVVAFGSGARPLIKCDDVIANASFVKTGGRTNVYEVVLNPVIYAPDAEWPGLYIDGVRAAFVTDLATCDSTAGSCHVASPFDGTTPITLYVHSTGSTDPTTDGKLYEAPVRSRSIDFYDSENCIVRGIKTRRNYGSYGLTLGRNCHAYDCEAIEGNTHNCFLRSGASWNGGIIKDAYHHNQSPTLFIAFDTNPTDGVYLRNAAISMTTYNANLLGAYMHTGAGSFPFFNIEGGTFDNCGQPISAANCDLLTVDGSVLTNFVTGFKVACNSTFNNLSMSLPKSGGIIGLSDLAGITVVVDGLTWNGTSTGNLRSVHNNTDFSLVNSTLTGIQTALRGTGTGQRWTMRNCQFIGGLGTTVLTLPAGSELDIDYNDYGGATGVWTLGGTTYNTLAEWQNATGQDLHSTA
jgi:hypothetical protein